MPNTAALTFVPTGRLVRGYAELLLKDIKPADFARQPNGVNCNHPAWCYGHLSVYPNAILEMIGRADLVKPNAKFKELFDNKTVCRDDPGAKIYPSMEEITSYFFERTDAALAAALEVDDAVLAKPNPTGLKDRLPTVGSMCDFMLGAHAMSHLGQISTWRRMMGLGSAM